MQNENDYFYHYNEFPHVDDFEKLFHKNDGAILVFEVLNNDKYLSLIDFYNSILLVHVKNDFLKQFSLPFYQKLFHWRDHHL